ncbi:MAG: putative membrane protein YdfK [Anaerolineales bacterium]|nr:putative membrane protein YdfK [Anaerolineales bacterium]
MTGTVLNIITVLIGGGIGLLFGARIPERFKSTVIAGMGLFTAAMGAQMFLKSENQLIVLGAMLIGTLLGEWMKIEDRLQAFGVSLEKRFSTEDESGAGSRFVRGFMVASLLFCIGPMTILGSIQDGLTGDYQLLAVKSTLDGFASIAFASTLGVGVLFSTIVILIFQGGISLLAGVLSAIISDPMMNEMTATGGVILAGLAVSNLLEIKKIRVGNFLPALAIAPLIVWAVGKL